MTLPQTVPGRRRAVAEGRLSATEAHTLSSSQLSQSKSGKWVSSKKQRQGKALYNELGNSGPKGWNKSVSMACDELGVPRIGPRDWHTATGKKNNEILPFNIVEPFFINKQPEKPKKSPTFFVGGWLGRRSSST